MRGYTTSGCIVAIVLFVLLLGVSFLLVRALTTPPEKAEEPAGARARAPEAEPPPEPETPKEADEAEVEWERPRFEERQEERARMVRRQIQQRGVRQERVLDAMRAVPRHLFVPQERGGSAYADHPLPIGYGQTISQPYIVASMTEQLELESGDKVLEVGTGSGYQAAVLSEITPHVFTIEIIEALAEQARERLRRLGYETIQVKHADGYFGWEEHAPFDAIIVTAAAGHQPPPLVKQLKPGGKMVIPLGSPYQTQQLVLLSKDTRGKVRTNSLMPVRFVPLTREVREE